MGGGGGGGSGGMSACHIDDRNCHVAGRETECRSSRDVHSANGASAWYLSIGRTRLTMRVPGISL